MSIILITASNELPVSLCGFKNHINFSGTSKDESLELMLRAAVDEAQVYTGLQIMPAIYETRLPAFESKVKLYPAPVTGVNSVVYFNAANEAVAMASGTDFYIDIDAKPAEVNFLNIPEVYPYRSDAVKINYGTGYASAELVPYAIKAAILLAAGGMYVNPTDAVRALPTASKSLLRNYRMFDE